MSDTGAPGPNVRIGVVAIGRNEGARLMACLASVIGTADRVVYVDSGSSDGSAGRARDLGVEVGVLDTRTPFTAARGRNEGFALLDAGAPVDFVQFVDGDCEVEPGWLDRARDALLADPSLGLVTGWRREIAPEASVYNRVLDVEWHRPAGPIAACGGDMMVRSEVFRAVGGFDGGVIASEDEDFVQRVLQTGHGAVRLPHLMTHHDAAMTRFGQWWRRNVRSGHGYAEIGGRHPHHFLAERRRVWVYGALTLLLLVSTIVLPVWLALLGIVLLYGLSCLRLGLDLHRQGLAPGEAARHAALYTVAKPAALQGMLTYHLRRLTGRARTIIEYK